MKRTPLKAKRRKQPSIASFRTEVLTSPCVMGPDGCMGRLEPHHIIAQEKLKKQARTFGVAGLSAAEVYSILNDPRNGIPLCERHHSRHTKAVERVPRSLVPPDAWAFADELQLRWWIEKQYPEACPDCGEQIINRGAHFERCTG